MTNIIFFISETHDFNKIMPDITFVKNKPIT